MAKTPSNHFATPQQASSEATTVMRRTLGQSYMALPAQTRLRFSLGVMAFALAGLVFSNKLEEKMPAPPAQGNTSQSSTS